MPTSAATATRATEKATVSETDTGDSLFPGGVGKTTPNTFPQLIDDVTVCIFDRLPDETWFYPGHGNDSTLGAERPNLAEWRERGW